MNHDKNNMAASKKKTYFWAKGETQVMLSVLKHIDIMKALNGQNLALV